MRSTPSDGSVTTFSAWTKSASQIFRLSCAVGTLVFYCSYITFTVDRFCQNVRFYLCLKCIFILCIRQRILTVNPACSSTTVEGAIAITSGIFIILPSTRMLVSFAHTHVKNKAVLGIKWNQTSRKRPHRICYLMATEEVWIPLLAVKNVGRKIKACVSLRWTKFSLLLVLLVTQWKRYNVINSTVLCFFSVTNAEHVSEYKA